MTFVFPNVFRAAVVSKLMGKLVRPPPILINEAVISRCTKSYKRWITCASINDYGSQPSENDKQNTPDRKPFNLIDENDLLPRKVAVEGVNDRVSQNEVLEPPLISDSLQNEEDIDPSLPMVDMLESSLINANEFHRLPPKCVSCGAVFQTVRSDQPGFLPREKLAEVSSDRNRRTYRLVRGQAPIICQSCHNLRHYNRMTVQPQHSSGALQQLQHLPTSRALILYVVDMFDMYGSIVPDMSSIVGDNKHVILIGNKIDKFASGTYTTGSKQMNYFKDSLIEAVDKFSSSKLRIVDTCLLSAVTGHGLENLVVKLNKFRRVTNHIYIVGGNNSGKSTLFNILQNLFNLPAKNRPLPPQAITHHVPGTTYSLVRYPIGKHSLSFLRKRFFTVADERKKIEEQEKEPMVSLADELIVELGLKKNIAEPEQPYRGYISDDDEEETALVEKQVELLEDSQKRRESLFLYDTPGIPNREQLLQFLTPDEIHLLKQKLWIVPETRILHPGQVLLIGGIARIDYKQISRPSKDDISVFEDVPRASQSIFITSFFPKQLPVHIASGERADELYEKHFGGKLLQIPCGSSERLKEFPKLEPLEYTITGNGWDRASKDIVFNGLGWVSVTAGHWSYVSLKVYTPQGIGQYIRDKPLMPEAIKRRGERGAKYLGHLNKQIYQSTRKKNPALTDHLDEANENTKELMKMIKEKKKYDKLCVQHERQRQRLEQGVVLGAFKRIGKLEKILEENRKKWFLEEKKLLPDGMENQ